MGEHPVVELAHRPALAQHEPAVKLFDLDTAEEVAHRDRRARRVPAHVARRAGGGEADSLLQPSGRGGRGEGTFL